MKILTIGHSALSTRARKVTPDRAAQVKRYMEEMLPLMYGAEGVGLAANQVGILERFFVMDCSSTQNRPWFVINPQIINQSDIVKTSLEGCLSIPGIAREIKRSAEIEVVYQDEDFKQQTTCLEGLFAICFQHELDHLNGILFIDHLSAAERAEALETYQLNTQFPPTSGE